MARVPANEGVSTVGETTERQLYADVASACRFEVKGQDDLSRGLVNSSPEDSKPSGRELLEMWADYVEMLKTVIVEHSQEVRRLGNLQILLIEHLEDHYKDDEKSDILHAQRAGRFLVRQYLPERDIVCSLHPPADRVKTLAGKRWQQVTQLTDQDIARRFDEFCQDQPVATDTAAREWFGLGARAVVFAGLLPRVNIQMGLQEGFKEALNALHSPKQFLSK